MSNCTRCKKGCLIEGSPYCFHSNNFKVDSNNGVYKVYTKKLEESEIEGSCPLYEEGRPISDKVNLREFFAERIHALLRDGVDEKGKPLRELNPRLVDDKDFLLECHVPYTDHGNNADGFILDELYTPTAVGTYRTEHVKKAVQKLIQSHESYLRWIKSGKS